MTETLMIRRGDDEQFVIDSIKDDDDEEYTLKTGDYIVFTVRESPRDDSPILLEVTSHTLTFTLPSDMTERIQAGWYSADIILFMKQADGSFLKKRIFPDDEYIEEYGRTGGDRNWKNFIVNAKVGLNDD